MDSVEQKVDAILINHLPHLNVRLAKLEAKVDTQGKVVWAVLTTTIATLATAIFK